MYSLCQMTDDALVKLYREGRNEAFDTLLLRHKDRLFAYIYGGLNTMSHLADDVFQETFVKVIVCLKEGRYTAEGHFFSWLTRIAHNIIVDLFRQGAQLPIVAYETGAPASILDQAHIVDSYHEAEIINEQTLRDVKRLMEHLPDTQREVVFMRYYENRSFKEIAERTGVSVNTSLGRMRYALINMRKMAADNGISLELV